MKQRDIVDAVNRLTVGYTSTWDDIKYDADKAIIKINSYLGANYPKMSDILRHPDAPYAIKQFDKYINIFPDRYILTIVIPFIASEILARDEEFTTIYNKYILEVEDGLFTMFSNEFNRVPLQFRQADTSGVFFTEDVPQHNLQRHIDRTLPVFKFRIIYHVNNLQVITDDELFIDNNWYNFNDEYTLKSITNKQYFNATGNKVFTLEGWYYDETCTQRASISGKIYSDIDVYAKWIEEDTLDVYYDGYNAYAYLKQNYPIKYLSVPDYIRGIKITGITGINQYKLLPTNNSIETLIIPDTLELIDSNSLINFKGTKLIFPDKGNISINQNGLYMPNSKLVNSEYVDYPIILTRAVTSISTSAFGTVSDNENNKDVVNVLYYPSANVFSGSLLGTKLITDKKVYKLIPRR